MSAGLRFTAPQLATLVDAAPSGSDWVFEMKYDGYRLEAVIEAHQVRLFTRRGNDWTAKFPGVAERLARLAVESAMLDGEVVALDATGKSTFSLLQQRLDASHDQDLTFFAFDLLHLDGKDLRDTPLAKRRAELERLLRRARMTTRGAIRLGQRLEGSGAQLITAACRVGLEGIIGKRNDAPYTAGRGPAWVKIKCGHRQEFVVVGFTPPKGSRVGIGSLLLAVHEHGKLRYAGRVGSGMPDDALVGLFNRLRKLARETPPLSTRPPGIPGGTHWVAPTLVVEVAFTEWTTDGLLRHPVFQGVREDKPASDVRREEPRMAARINAASRPANTRTKAAGRAAKSGSAVAEEATVAGVRITHPDRLVFPEAGFTKLDLAQHFERVADVMLPHVAGRPLSLVRCPEGTAHECFFQKHWSGTRPPSIDAVGIVQGDGKKHPHVVMHDVAGLVTLAQWGVVEVHPWGSRADDPERPDRLIFDLDPGPGITWDDVKEATRGVRALLAALGLDSWLKTSGGKGLHVVVPIARRVTWGDASAFARAIALHMQATFPDRFIAKSSKAARHGLIFVDWLRNTRGATAVAPWSPRARPAAGVSVPVEWSRLGRLTSGDEFTLASVGRTPPRRDPWHALLASKQALTAKMLSRLT